MLETEKISGCEGVPTKTHAWSAGGHSKIAWVTDSSGSPDCGYDDMSNFLWHQCDMWLIAI